MTCGKTAAFDGVAVTVTAFGPSALPESVTLAESGNPGPKFKIAGDTATDGSLELNATVIADAGADDNATTTLACAADPNRSSATTDCDTCNVGTTNPPPPFANLKK